jgi:signal transduction histidine kinase/CheY-like chemotaxis protein
MKRDKRSVYYQAIQRWFVAGDHWVFPKWLIWLMIGFGGLLLIFLSTNLILRNRIKARTAELTEKNIELMNVIEQRKKDEIERFKLETQLQRAQKMEAIGTLAGGVAHDLNNILSGLVSYPELLLLELPEDSPLRKPILTIQKSGENAASVVNDLLTLARRGVAVTEVLNLNRIISDYLNSPGFEKLKLDHSQVQVETRLGENLLNIVGSPIHLSKTVMNLVSNAVESMPQGGTLIIDTENRYIDQPIRGYDTIEEGDYVVCSVSDGGVGISSEDIDRIFEPFYTKKVMGLSGTGLGMAVVWGTVKDHNGYIDVRSTEDKGTTFTLYFPVTREKLPKEIIQASIDKFKGNGELILVVDDVAEQRDIASGMLTKMLTKLGYRVATVSSGEQAVRFLEKDRADLLVLDMIMEPGMDGLDTYIKALKIEPRQKAIIASGFSETDRVKEARNLGAGAYVKKPYTMEKLGLAVRRELDKT